MTNEERPRCLAIDGPAASGKSAAGSAVARDLGYPFIDTGAIYRAVAWLALTRGVEPGDSSGLTALANDATIELRPDHDDAGNMAVFIDGVDSTPHLRGESVERNVSQVSAVPGVRARLVAIQRQLASNGAVMAGRDIGSVVLPDADLKIYLDASPEERARRRMNQFASPDEATDYQALVEQIRSRDEQDRGRPVAPLQVPDGAVRLVTDGMSLESVIARILELWAERTNGQKRAACAQQAGTSI
jgi:cytidylate kinase